MALGRGEHGLEPQAGLVLTLGPGRRAATGLAQPRDDRVAVALEVGHALQARARAGGRRRRERPVPHMRRELRVEAGELGPQGAADRERIGRDERVKGLGSSGDGHGQPPIGARGLAPQKSWVPSMPMRWTRTMLRTMDLAVAVPTPTGPPEAL